MGMKEGLPGFSILRKIALPGKVLYTIYQNAERFVVTFVQIIFTEKKK